MRESYDHELHSLQLSSSSSYSASLALLSSSFVFCFFFFFNDTATTEIYPLSLHAALPISIGPDGKRLSPYSANLASDPDPHRRWDAQYPSLWITHGGGGTFANIWTPSTFAQAGL